MVEIIPAVMPDNFSDLKEKLSSVAKFVPFVQIDIMDGVFVPPRSWPYVEGGPQEFSEIKSEHVDFPFSETLGFEVDLMVATPEAVVDDWMHAGARRIIVHIESDPDMQRIIEMTKKGDVPVELGLALNTKTPLEEIYPHIDSVDVVQCMGIAEIGYQGHPFDDKVLEHITNLRKRYPELIISVDGGVNLDNAPKLIEAGVNRLAIGSAIFKSKNIQKTIEQFKALAAR